MNFARKTHPLERAIEAKVRKHCHDNNLLCYKFTSPSRQGVLDRLILGKGKAMFLELKRKGKEPTPLQYREIALLTSKGLYATWCDSYEKAVEIIDDFFATSVEEDEVI